MVQRKHSRRSDASERLKKQLVKRSGWWWAGGGGGISMSKGELQTFGVLENTARSSEWHGKDEDT